MYVVPWKKPELGDLGGRPARSLVDEALAPVDRDVFRRQNRYFTALQADTAPRSAVPALRPFLSPTVAPPPPPGNSFPPHFPPRAPSGRQAVPCGRVSPVLPSAPCATA